jgi:hypothetical protein
MNVLNLNQNKMDFTLGFVTGAFIMFVVAKRLQIEWKKEIEELKDFDTWKEWKNESKG